jgi:transposase-like protein
LACGLRWSQTVIPPRPEAGTARRAVVINKSHDYAKLEREYITSQISIRELCRRHGITAHSLVTVQARKGKWQEKREQYQAKSSDAYIERYAARQADRQAEIHDTALDAIDEAISRFREDLKATETKLVDGEWVEVPVMRLTPRDLAVLIDWLQVLLDRPSRISEGRDLSLSSTLSLEGLNELIERTQGRGKRSPMEASPLPRTQRLDD